MDRGEKDEKRQVNEWIYATQKNTGAAFKWTGWGTEHNPPPHNLCDVNGFVYYK